MLVTGDVRGIDAGYLYRGELPRVGDMIEVEDELDPSNRRRAKVVRITGRQTEKPLIHARQVADEE